jgi:hypothetical protein
MPHDQAKYLSIENCCVASVAVADFPSPTREQIRVVLAYAAERERLGT